MFTAAEVDRMGGHTAVKAFRRGLMSGSGSASASQLRQDAALKADAASIWSPAPDAMSGPARSARPMVMDSGGYLMPGWNPPIYNGTGRLESVTPAAAMDTMIVELRTLRRDVVRAVEQVGPDVGGALNGSMESARQLGRAQGRTYAR
ncbi:hypothetical protein AB0C50_16775 [Micromonospora taraxaci]|uniref:hypothetical protein n=1 Tax=Micromonospora taraxaci TaxID=1316803 RepID=UPI0033F4030C